MDGGVLYRGVRAWALAQQNLPGERCERAGCRILEARRAALTTQVSYHEDL
jgi:hypothetical protein